ncbi:MAG: DOMON domain-containing protein [Candidatus Zixiibacteriota bacterium]|jgi:hypothetical protein
MYKLKKPIVRAVLVAAALTIMGTSGCNTADDEVTPGGNGGTVTASGITLSWQPNDTTLHVTMLAPTTGWVAVAFDPSTGMADSNMIIGYVAAGTVYARDDFGTSPTGHDADTNLGGADDVADATGKEENGSTEISFTIPLDSGDIYDKKLIVGQTYRVLLANGPDGSDDFSSRHEVRTAVNITI